MLKTLTLILLIGFIAGCGDKLERLTHKEAWKETVDGTLMVGGTVVGVATLVNAAGSAGSGSGGGTYSRYKGNCEYDYQIAADGTRCGARSAYSREGGWEP